MRKEREAAMKKQKEEMEAKRIQEEAMHDLEEKRGLTTTQGTFKVNGLPEIETTNFN